MVNQYLRACSLIVADTTGNGVELAGPDQTQTLRIRFTVNYMINQTPASLTARVYNLSPATIQKIVDLASQNRPTASNVPLVTSARVILKAGYIDNISTIFVGQIYQLRVGKERNVDSFLDIFASDGDFAYSYSNLRETLPKGYTADDVWTSSGKSMNSWQVGTGKPPKGLSSNPAPRGRVLYGMTRNVLRDMANTHNFNWAIRDGELQGLRRYTVSDGEAIVINSQTGMVGVPEQTENGITVVTLLNPAIRWGQKIHLNNTEISRLLINAPGVNSQTSVGAPGKASLALVPPLDSDGIYVVLIASHQGDTRGNEWYSKLTCISVDPTIILPPSQGVVLPPPFS